MIAAYRIRKIIDDHPADDEQKVNSKYYIFLASFLLEDLGQILCQECVEIIRLQTAHIT